MRHRRSVRQPRNAKCWSNLWELLRSQDWDGTRNRLQQVVKPVFSNILLRGVRTYVAAPPTAHGDGGSQVGVIERAGGSTSSNVKHAAIFQLSCPLELGLSRAPSLDNPSVQPQGLRECSGAGANELQPAHLGQHTHNCESTCRHTHAHARTRTPACSSRHFSDHTSQAAFSNRCFIWATIAKRNLCATATQRTSVQVPKGHQVFLSVRCTQDRLFGQCQANTIRRQESPRIQLAEAQCHNMDEKADEIRMPPLERRTSTPPPLDLKVSPGVCSSLHLVTCWHQNLTHALRKNVE